MSNKSLQTQLDDVLIDLDNIHTQILDQKDQKTIPINKNDLIDWLEDIVFTAEQSIQELKT